MQKQMEQISQSFSVFAKRRPIDAGGQRNTSFPKGRVDEEAMELEMTIVPNAVVTVQKNPMNGESKQDTVSVHVDPASGRQYTYDEATKETKWIEAWG